MRTDLNPQRVIRTGDAVEHEGKRYKVHYVVDKNGQTSLESLLGKIQEVLAVRDGQVVHLKPGEFNLIKETKQ
jgi:hypothetical protein